jgi:hypothetical protein
MKHILFIILIFLVSCKPNMKQNEGIVKHDADSTEKQSRGIGISNIPADSVTGYAKQEFTPATERIRRDVFMHVGVKTRWPDFQTITFDGIAFEAKVVDLKMQGDFTKSAWMAFRYRYQVNGEWQIDWAQVGWYKLNSGPIGFAFFVYHISGPLGYGQANLDVNYVDASADVVLNEVTRFEIANIKDTNGIGTNRWNVNINGKTRFDVDLGTNIAGDSPPETSSNNSIEFFTEVRGGNTFSTVVHVNYLQYRKDGIWVNTPTARSSGQGWNVEGQVQNSALRPSEFELGGRGFLQDGTLLW